ncbi:MAG: hypothetical protein J5J06_15715 [Phycisphaerae bacterium]|nr:hypothetical protein [Phycisphaerae bacterium]
MMADSKLAVLLERIAADRTLDEVDRRVDAAMNSFSYPAGRITDVGEFRRCVTDFLGHVEARVWRLPEPVAASFGFNWGRCLPLLLKEYGPNGEKAAFEMARTGTEGGVYRVLKDLARRLAGQYAENEVAARIAHYWNGLSTKEKLAAPDEYLERFGHLLPSELTEGSAGRLRADFPRVLGEHPALMQRLSRIGRS